MPVIRAVPFDRVRFEGGLLAERIETNRTATLPVAWARCEESGRLWNFERAAAALSGEPPSDRRPPGFPFDDTDVYKLIEGASYCLTIAPDPELDARLDRVIATIAAAQEPDGYLYTTRTLCPEAPHAWAGARRWECETDLSHELYNLGHLFEAAVAHQRATGKHSLLDVAVRAADLLDGTFGPDERSIWPGHQIAEMGLVRLAAATGSSKYVDLARFLLDERGPDGSPRSGDPYNQSHARVRDQTEAVGHAVRATYLYAGMADVAASGELPEYVAALRAIWADIVRHKLYVTGGIGADASKEAFGAPDELPNRSAYNETCAAIGLVYFAHRMFLLEGRSCFVDVLERVLYNGLLSGVSLDGETFFYPNPLESHGEHARSEWFACACCPGNIARFLASLPGYAYACSGDEVYVNLFAAGTAQIELEDGCGLTIVQRGNYPWSGCVELCISEISGPAELCLQLRVPGWARGEVVPSDLYAFSEPTDEAVTLELNGRRLPLEVTDGYVRLRRVWQRGDELRLNLPMPVRRVESHERVQDNRGRIALQRGPIVYALEGHDHAGGRVLDLRLSDVAALEARFQADVLGGVVTLSGRAVRDEGLDVALTAIPYFAWANRGATQMLVWMERLGA